ncbi:hypothetical protein [Arsukibacterium sp.]|uniref:hypothetical protein n=1 Tax=Arsukibacterium sp. TaxID=1977258 RepID=UPI001BD576A7|nr:hypothetical protein [Arsukibacterium sp.]
MRALIILLSLFLLGCNADIDPCNQISLGISESELVDRLGEPFQKSDEEENKLAYMYKGKNIPSIIIVELEINVENTFLVSHCNVM